MLNENNARLCETSANATLDTNMHPAHQPHNVKKDVTLDEQKKRVSGILKSQDFKEELETVVADLIKSDQEGVAIANVIANVFSPPNRTGRLGVGCVSPINDLAGADAKLYSKEEKLLRCKLAALYRIVDVHGWSSTIFNHITARISQEQEHFLINPFGLLYNEVSASKLIKVNMQGEIVDSGSTTLGINSIGYSLHSAIHAARPDIRCVIHVQTSDALSVSYMDCGLLPISQEALIAGDVSVHPYSGCLVDSKEKKAIQKHLGPVNKVMVIQRYGIIVCGETVEEAFHYLFNTMEACKIQVKALSCAKREKLILLDRSFLKLRTEDVGKQDPIKGAEESIPWGVGGMMFEAFIRMLDNLGYRSGYVYNNPILMKHKPRAKTNVELPATVVGRAAVLDESLESKKPQQLHNQIDKVIDEQTMHRTSSNTKENSNICDQGCLGENPPEAQSRFFHGTSTDTSISKSKVIVSSKAMIEKEGEVKAVSSAEQVNPFNQMTDASLKEHQKEALEDMKKDEHENEDVIAIDVCNVNKNNNAKAVEQIQQICSEDNDGKVARKNESPALVVEGERKSSKKKKSLSFLKKKKK